MTLLAQTTRGDLRGAEGGGVISFRNVPYAAPPVGALRFAPPAPAAPWTGLRDATAHGPIGPQPPSRLRAAMGDFDRPQSEDCLTLTIATPGIEGARPVIVWLHGGAYMTGAGSLDWYDGATLARANNVVVVGVNYRLGALGFLCHPAIGDGNYALLDMAAALGWVRDNIAGFGGDPARVTVMGQSAGAHAIMCLLTMPDARKLFHRAILMSAPPSLVPLQPADAAANAERLFKILDLSPGASDAATRLRETPVETLIEAQMAVTRAGARFADISPPFVPMIDGISSVVQFIAAAAAGAAAGGVDMVIGTTREEMHAFFVPDPAMANPPPDAVAERFSTLAGAADAMEHYRDRRPGAGVAELLGDLVTDHMFLFPSLALAVAATSLGRRVFAYQFDWSAPGGRFGACHCIDLPFVFGNAAEWPGAAMLEGGDSAEIAGISAAIGAAFAAFAHGGDPSCAALPWPTYESSRRMTMCYGPIIGIVGDPAGITWRAGLPA